MKSASEFLLAQNIGAISASDDRGLIGLAPYKRKGFAKITCVELPARPPLVQAGMLEVLIVPLKPFGGLLPLITVGGARRLPIKFWSPAMLRSSQRFLEPMEYGGFLK